RRGPARIRGGILARREQGGDRADLEMHAIPPIDLVVVNLYPFEATVAQRGVTLAEAIEKIDIGGPSMIRSAAKNHAYVGVVVDPDDYLAVLGELRAKGGLDGATRARLARKALERTARRASDPPAPDDARPPGGPAPREAGAGAPSPPHLGIELARAATLRYGENPHQRAALYGRFFDVAEPLHGKELSFNNIVDV